MALFRASPARPRIEPVLRDFEPPSPAGTGGISGGATTTFSTPQLWGMFGGWSGSTGEPITPLSALQAAAVYGCIKVLSEDVGKVPVRIKRRLKCGGSVVDRDHPANRILCRRPNVWQTRFDYWSYCTTAFLLRGNAFSAVKRGNAGQPLALVPINPDRCSVMISPRGWLYYCVSHPQLGDGVMLRQEDMVHIRNISIDGGYLGLSAIAMAQDVIGVTIAAQQHGATLFRQGAQPSGIITHPNKLSPEAARRIGQEFNDKFSGVQNAHKTIVFEENMKYEKLTMTSEDAQLLETRKYGVIDICRLFRVPPHKVMDLTDAHYSNMDQATNEYIDDGVEPICLRQREHLEETIFFQDERDTYFLEHDYSVLARGDRKTRYDCHAIALTNGFKTVNEVRSEEGMNMVPGGDVFRAPLNTGISGGNPQTSVAPEAQDVAGISVFGQPSPPPDTSPVENVIPV